MTGDSDAAAVRRLIKQARRAVVFTGAGISTESGDPGFPRPVRGLDADAPIYFDDFLASEEARRETSRRSLAMEDTFAARVSDKPEF